MGPGSVWVKHGCLVHGPVWWVQTPGGCFGLTGQRRRADAVHVVGAGATQRQGEVTPSDGLPGMRGNKAAGWH